ncbi:MAG: hypothetical protein KAU16_03480 [Methanophagales archaeon]|nr:hypothetical protein [Methanophagales archaeon]
MNKKEIAILGVLAITITGAGIAFVYVGTNIGMMEKVPYKVEEIPGQNETETEEVPKLTEVPSEPEELIIGKNDTEEIPELTEEQKEKAKDIALSDLEVKKMIEGKGYEIKVTPMIMTGIINGETKKTTKISVNFEFEDGARMKVFVDLDKEGVTRIWSRSVIKPQRSYMI